MKRYIFLKDDAVPAFMLDVEPMSPGGPRPLVTFTTDVEVFETERFVAMALIPSETALVKVDNIEGGEGEIVVFAPSKPFVIVDRWTMLDSDGGGDSRSRREPILST